MSVLGYADKILRVGLVQESMSEETLDEATLRKWLGGAGLGAKYLYEEVPPGVEWNDPENRLIISSGPLAGTRAVGSGTITVTTKGPLTNGATSTQANGYLGAYMKFSGYDAIIIQGAAPSWKYLYLHDGTAELRDASHLVGKETWEVEDVIKAELGYRERDASVFCIGPAGENLVKFAAICGDKGHAAGHNGTGAVMATKRLKAVVAARSRGSVNVKNRQQLSRQARAVFDVAKDWAGGRTHKWGTFGDYAAADERIASGRLPVKNLTTNLYPEARLMTAEYARSQWPTKPNPCWACTMSHCRMMTITSGPYAGLTTEEPEYEATAAWGSTIGNTDTAGMIYLNHITENLGFEVNEAGWLMGMVLELYEKGVLSKEDTEGLELTWGNVPAISELLRRVAHRQGRFANILAEGVMRAAEALGEEAQNCGIYLKKGLSPRGHDHRAMWREMFDTATASTGTYQAGTPTYPQEVGLASAGNIFDGTDVATITARNVGRRQFEDTLGTCIICTRVPVQQLAEMVGSATGWDISGEEAQQVGFRIANILRAFNVRHGITPEVEYPSPRYWSAPVDGPAQGISVQPVWEQMLDTYYQVMNWDRQTGRPYPETLRALGLEEVVKDIWEVEPAR